MHSFPEHVYLQKMLLQSEMLLIFVCAHELFQILLNILKYLHR